MVVWSQYLSNIADFMNVTSTQAGIIHSLGITIIAIILVLIASKGKNALVTVPVTSFFSILLFSYIEWFPIWTGSVIALVLVIFLGFVFGKVPGVD